MKALVGISVAVVLLVIAGIHVYWAFGGELGADSAVPQIGTRPAFVPEKWGTLAVAALLVVAGLSVAAATGAWGSKAFGQLARWPTGFTAFVFLARAVGDFRYVGFFKHGGASRFAQLDRAFFSPLCLALATGCAFVLFA